MRTQLQVDGKVHVELKQVVEIDHKSVALSS